MKFPIACGVVMLAISLVAGFGSGAWEPMVALVLMVEAFIVVQIVAALTGN